jgi:hypothetical protein
MSQKSDVFAEISKLTQGSNLDAVKASILEGSLIKRLAITNRNSSSSSNSNNTAGPSEVITDDPVKLINTIALMAHLLEHPEAATTLEALFSTIHNHDRPNALDRGIHVCICACMYLYLYLNSNIIFGQISTLLIYIKILS